MNELYELRDMLKKSLSEMQVRQNMGTGELQHIHMITDTIKNIDKILMLENGEQSGYSRNGSGYAYGRGYSRNSGDSRSGMWDRGNSYHGDGQDSRERIKHRLRELMDEADGKEREVIQRWIVQLDSN